MKSEDIKIGNIIHFGWADDGGGGMRFWNKIEESNWVNKKCCVINTKIIKQSGAVMDGFPFYGHNINCYMLCMYEKKLPKGGRFYAEMHMTQSPNKFASCFGKSDIKRLKAYSASGRRIEVGILNKTEQFILCL
tara:strand:+ start:8097 stop:8498 length:402 start_codon:yes stop_codon:yes gene_type:complete